MLAALALSLALGATPSCRQVEIATTGRSAHGSAIMPTSAPHLLIRALGRLPDGVESSKGMTEARITSLVAAPALNIIPRRAVAVVDISFDDAVLDQDALVAELVQLLGPRVEITLLAGACRPRP